MKIRCDVCDREVATVFCSADEAALCGGCDHRVHLANKLAGKHIRFSLLHPSFKQSPRCDICQERRAFLFCKEDRAILCGECDIPIHTANSHTQKHNRFLLTGVQLSAASLSSSPSTSSPCQASSLSSTVIGGSGSSSNVVATNDSEIKSSSFSSHQFSNTSSMSTTTSSTISQYLMETLPGWRVDDFLDPSCSPHGFRKPYGHELPHSDRGFVGEILYPLLGDSAISVPQAPPEASHVRHSLTQTSVNDAPKRGLKKR